MSIQGIIGILPVRLKYARTIRAVEEADLPSRAIVLVPRGGPGELLVSAGSTVLSGEVVYRAGADSVYSTVTGEVAGIYDLSWLDGRTYDAVEIRREGEERWSSLFEGVSDFSGAGREKLLSHLDAAGYDTSLFTGEGAGVAVVNCFESDLLVSGAGAVLEKRKDEISSGIDLLRELTGAGRVVLAVPPAYAGLVSGISGAEVAQVKAVYPWGMDELLSRSRKWDGGGDVVVVGAELLSAMVMSLKSGRPRYEKMVTLIREGNVAVKNIAVRIGTPVSEILEREGIRTGEGYKVVLGGPMRGGSVYHGDFPVLFESDALLIQGETDIVEVSDGACLNCGRCVRVCPQRLQVNLLCRYAEFGLFDRCMDYDIGSCVECGMCGYVCTSRRPLVQFIQFAKNELAKGEEEADGTE